MHVCGACRLPGCLAGQMALLAASWLFFFFVLDYGILFDLK